MDIFSRTLHTVARHGADPQRLQRYAEEHARGRCCLCGAPYCGAPPADPCPCWLAQPGRLVDRVADIIGAHGLAGVLHYLLACAQLDQSVGRPYRVLFAARSGPLLRFELRLRGRFWRFELDEAAGALSLHMRARSGRRLRCALSVAHGDIMLLRALVDEVAAPVRFTNYAAGTGMEIRTPSSG